MKKHVQIAVIALLHSISTVHLASNKCQSILRELCCVLCSLLTGLHVLKLTFSCTRKPPGGDHTASME